LKPRCDFLSTRRRWAVAHPASDGRSEPPKPINLPARGLLRCDSRDRNTSLLLNKTNLCTHTYQFGTTEQNAGV